MLRRLWSTDLADMSAQQFNVRVGKDALTGRQQRADVMALGKRANGAGRDPEPFRRLRCGEDHLRARPMLPFALRRASSILRLSSSLILCIHSHLLQNRKGDTPLQTVPLPHSGQVEPMVNCAVVVVAVISCLRPVCSVAPPAMNYLYLCRNSLSRGIAR